MIGQTISHYKITAKLGEGGMGVVYKAEDTKLKRPVALKFIAANLIKDSEARKRFEREATAAAGVSHANVCHVYEIADADGHTFLAMEFIEGESLDRKIERGPLPLKDAFDLALQAAEGLAAAHEHGVVHRDIKPGNLLITPKGQVKILDFGLALLAEGSKLTKLGTQVGTVAYMSPEQTQGLEVDRRADVWALGCVLYEMVSGRRPFLGHYDQALIYSIVNEPPEPLTALRTGVPMELEFIVAKCLEKDAGSRYQHSSDLAVDLRNLQDKLKSGRSVILRGQVVSQTVKQPPAVTTQLPAGPLVRYRVIENLEESADSIKYLAEDTELQRSVSIRVLPQSSAERIERAQRRKHVIVFGVGALGVLAGIFLALTPLVSPPPAAEVPLRRFAISPPVAIGTSDNNDIAAAVSPNGRHIVFIEAGSQGGLWVQDLAQPSPRVIEGTAGAFSPFWSPGSDFIGFGLGNEIRKISVQGGPATRVSELPGAHFHGPSWSADGEVIFFGSGGPPHELYEVPARGGTPKRLIAPDEIEPSTGGRIGAPYWTHFLPSDAGDRVLVLVFRSPSGDNMVVQDFETGRREFLGPGNFPVYSPSGHLLYQSARGTVNLWALPFSLTTLKSTGEAFPIAEKSRHATVAADQTLVYVEDPEMERRQLVWIDRRGVKRGEVSGVQGMMRAPALSPDGRLVALAVTEGGNEDVWVYDLARGSKTRLSSGAGYDTRPVWSPTGGQVAFLSERAANGDIVLRQSDASAAPQILADTPAMEIVNDWSGDGEYILYTLFGTGTGVDLWYLERNEDSSAWEPHPFLQTPLGQFAGQFSPDGRHVAYISNESGRNEVHIQPFPEGGRRVTVSNNGGAGARWSRDGKELFYVEGRTLVAVSVSYEPQLSLGSAVRLFENPGLTSVSEIAPYDVSADSQQFILAEPVAAGADAPKPAIRVVLNWFEEFRGREKN